MNDSKLHTLIQVGCLILMLLLLFASNIFWGAVSIPAGDIIDVIKGNTCSNEATSFIVLYNRLPQACTAALAGCALSVAGLLLQTIFHNPLAGPSILGISSGASLGVALVMMVTGGSIAGALASISVIASAIIGALAITGILLMLSLRVRNNITLLVAGMMISYILSSFITLLTYNASSTGVKAYVVWGMGDFSMVTLSQLPWFATIILITAICSITLVKHLNAILLGEQYADSMGISTKKLRTTLLLITGVLTATTTAFCGPISFIGLAVPHLTRMIYKTDDFRLLLPATMITGAAVALLCNVLCTVPSSSILPLAAVTPIIGAPIVIWVVLKR